jgi:potassium/chloride transporter 9
LILFFVGLDTAEKSTYNGTMVYTGFHKATLDENMMPDLQIDYTTGSKQTVSLVFGVLFNGVTGIMAGANMSGDLKDASKSIPRGTLQAAGFTLMVYVLLFILSAATCERNLMLNQYGYLQEINKVGRWHVIFIEYGEPFLIICVRNL